MKPIVWKGEISITNVLFLMMGGVGSRFGAEKPKQFTVVDGKPIFRYILDAYNNYECVDRIVVICNEEWIDYTKTCLADFVPKKELTIIPGGNSRSASVRNGVNSLLDDLDDSDCIMVHDSTHPYLDREAVKIALDKTNFYDGVTLVQKEYDTCYSIDEEAVNYEIPKKTVVSGASPEIFHYGDLVRMYGALDEGQLEKMTSVGALALENNLTMCAVPMDVLNIKITFQKDMDLFKLLCSSYFFKE